MSCCSQPCSDETANTDFELLLTAPCQLHDKYNSRFERLNNKGTFDESINAARAAGSFHTELLRRPAHTMCSL